LPYAVPRLSDFGLFAHPLAEKAPVASLFRKGFLSDWSISNA